MWMDMRRSVSSPWQGRTELVSGVTLRPTSSLPGWWRPESSQLEGSRGGRTGPFWGFAKGFPARRPVRGAKAESLTEAPVS